MDKLGREECGRACNQGKRFVDVYRGVREGKGGEDEDGCGGRSGARAALGTGNPATIAPHGGC